MGNKSELFTGYADRYVTENYGMLEAKFRVLDSTINDKCHSALDILNDTMISLYDKEHLFKSYEEFEKWASNKFTPKNDRKRR